VFTERRPRQRATSRYIARVSLKGIAKETLRILDEGGYGDVRFGAEQAAAVEGTRLYTPDDLSALRSDASGTPRFEVTEETTQEAALRLFDEGERVVLLNFASARNPGGGFINGAKAQEEDLARCSGLYPCLITQPVYYEENRAEPSVLYTDHIIYSPDVPFFRTDSRELLDRFFLASVITAPAPNAGQWLARGGDAGELDRTLRRRAELVLAVAAHEGHRTVLLGAWGCGVFRNDPARVADAFGRAVQRHAFDRVVFGILDKSEDERTRGPFRARFG
jgi:uncharacterized protein (TIGR02452 family)